MHKKKPPPPQYGTKNLWKGAFPISPTEKGPCKKRGLRLRIKRGPVCCRSPKNYALDSLGFFELCKRATGVTMGLGPQKNHIINSGAEKQIRGAQCSCAATRPREFPFPAFGTILFLNHLEVFLIARLPSSAFVPPVLSSARAPTSSVAIQSSLAPVLPTRDGPASGEGGVGHLQHA